MISIFSVHVVIGVVDPQFTSDQIAGLVDILLDQYGVPVGPGMAAIVERPRPESEEEEVMQAISPGTHEVNIIFDFDPNSKNFTSMLLEDTMWSRYNSTNVICSTICFAALKSLNCVPTYFNIKLNGDYITEEAYEKMQKHRFKK